MTIRPETAPVAHLPRTVVRVPLWRRVSLGACLSTGIKVAVAAVILVAALGQYVPTMQYTWHP